MSIDPHKPVPWPMQIQPTNRGFDTGKDGALVNAYQEKMADGSIETVKRPAFQFASAGVTGYARGAHQRLFVSAKNIYRITDGAFLGAMTGINSQAPATFADLDFASLDTFINTSFRDGNTFGIAGASWTEMSGPKTHHAGPYAPGVVWLNGTVYVMTYDGRIYGSDVGAYTTWQSGNVIATNVQASVAMALAKQKVYVIAFSRFSTTVFYNAGNPTGSPLRLLPGGQSSIGLYDNNTLQSVGDDLFWVGSPSTVNLSVYKMSDLKITKISTPAIDRLISSSQFTTYPYAITGDEPVFPARSLTLAIHGHRYYVLNLYNIGHSLVYDTDFGVWYIWHTAAGVALPYFTPLTYGGNIATENYGIFQQPQLNRFMHTNGGIYQLNASVYADHDGVIDVSIRTDNFDAGDKVKKYMKRFDFLTDQVPGSSMSVRHTEDDYVTWSPVRTVDLSQKFPHLDNCGTFRQRAYLLNHTAITPFRLRGAIAHLIPGSL